MFWWRHRWRHWWRWWWRHTVKLSGAVCCWRSCKKFRRDFKTRYRLYSRFRIFSSVDGFRLFSIRNCASQDFILFPNSRRSRSIFDNSDSISRRNASRSEVDLEYMLIIFFLVISVKSKKWRSSQVQNGRPFATFTLDSTAALWCLNEIDRLKYGIRNRHNFFYVRFFISKNCNW